MKQIDDLLKFLGTDKVLHYSVGGLLAACIVIALQAVLHSIYAAWAVSAVTVFALSVWKESKDNVYDWWDIFFAMAGTFTVLLSIMANTLIFCS